MTKIKFMQILFIMAIIFFGCSMTQDKTNESVIKNVSIVNETDDVVDVRIFASNGDLVHEITLLPYGGVGDNHIFKMDLTPDIWKICIRDGFGFDVEWTCFEKTLALNEKEKIIWHICPKEGCRP